VKAVRVTLLYWPWNDLWCHSTPQQTDEDG